MSELAPLPIWPVLAAALGLLLPWGAACLASPGDDAPRPPFLALMVTLLAMLGMAATGFALAFGGVGIPIDHPDLAALVWEWTPLREGSLAWWGVAGWMGFGMHGAQTPLAAWLFLAALPGVAAVSVLTVIPLWRRMSPVAGAIMAGLTVFVLAPLAVNWTQAGGWLMHLGESVGAGEGFIDAGGASLFLLPAGVALAALFLPRGEAEAGDDGWVAWGAGAFLIGGVGWLVASPLPLWAPLAPIQGALNALLAASAGGLIGLLYGWAVQRGPSPRWTARSAAAGFIAALAGIQLLQPMQAMLVGAVAAWIYILAAYVINDLLDRGDAGDVLGAFGLPALWGVLAAGFFAPAPGQMRAQVIGGASILLMGFLVAFLLQFPLALYHAGRSRKARSDAGMQASVESVKEV